MALKKNDKIIIAIGIVIIIVAAALIAVYAPPKDEEAEEILEEGLKTYELDWNIRSGSLSTMSEYAGKRAAYEGTFKINKGNLKSIVCNLSWVDDKTFLGRLGRDTLTLEITTPDEKTFTESAQTAAVTKEGNIEITISVGNTPSSVPIEAEDLSDAQDMLNEEPYYKDKWVNEDFDVMVSVKVGEILGNLRPRDRGNSFELKITYEYYDADLIEEETKETSQQGEDLFDLKDEDYLPLYSSILSTGIGRSF
jgi:hypothetical protein